METQISGNYYLRSDKLNLMLSEKRTVLSGKNVGREYFEDKGYYRTLPQVLQALLDRKIILSEATTLEQLAQDYTEAIESLTAFCKRFEGQIKEMQKNERDQTKAAGDTVAPKSAEESV